MRLCCAVFLFALLTPALAPGAVKTIDAPLPVVDLGLANIRLEMYGWEHADRRWTPAPGLFTSNGSMRDQLLSARYQQALAGHWPPGSREIFGFIGGPYPNDYRFEVLSFHRTGPAIDITLRRHDTGGKGDGYRSWKILYLSALLPPDPPGLPEGKYSVQCIVQDANGKPDSMTHNPPQCDLTVPNPWEVEAAAARDRLKTLPDDEIIKEYLNSGIALGKSPLAPRETPVPNIPLLQTNDPQYLHFTDAAQEIVRRGPQLIPLLIDTLAREAPRTASSADEHAFGFARGIMEMMVAINDPRPVDLLIEILDGYQGKASTAVRKAALDSLEQLTFITFRRHSLLDGRTRWAVQDAQARSVTQSAPIFGPQGPDGQASLFRAYLSTEGTDPSHWLVLAITRAHEQIAGDDLSCIYAAADFLQNSDPTASRDDQPLTTLDRLGQLLLSARQVGFRAGNYDYQINSRPLPLTIGDWSRLLAHYNTLARPYAKALVRFDQEIALPSADRIDQLSRIGGEEIVGYLIKRLPELDERLASAELDAKTNPDEITDQRLRQTLQADQLTRAALFRWTGHLFTNQTDPAAWWEQSKNKTQGQMLRDALENLATQADASHPQSEQLLRQLLPDLPHASEESSATSPSTQPARYRAQWLREHQPWLIYDDRAGVFRIDAAAWP